MNTSNFLKACFSRMAGTIFSNFGDQYLPCKFGFVQTKGYSDAFQITCFSVIITEFLCAETPYR